MKRLVSKEELRAFLKNYPRPLTYNFVGFAEPPHREWHDFTLGEPKDGTSRVAHIVLQADSDRAYGEPVIRPDQHYIDQETK